MRNTLNNSETHSQWAPKWDSHSYGLAYYKLQGEAIGVGGWLIHPCFNRGPLPKAQLSMRTFSSLFDQGLTVFFKCPKHKSQVIYGSPEPWIPLRFSLNNFYFPWKKKKRIRIQPQKYLGGRWLPYFHLDCNRRWYIYHDWKAFWRYKPPSR